MRAIFKREMRAYFTTPVGYVFIGVFLILSGIQFILYNLLRGYPSLDSVLYSLTSIFMFLIPVLTMRLLSEEKNTKTDRLLLTSPVKVSDIVLGKFFSAAAVYLITLLLTLLYLFVIAKHTHPAYPQIFCNYLGFALLGLTYISIGLFISSFTENQIISAVITFAVLLALYCFDAFKSAVANPFMSALFGALAIPSRFEEFNLGVLGVAPVVYYISITAFFLFLSMASIERRRLG